jgi:hypothetical protein
MTLIDRILGAVIETPITWHEESGFQPEKAISIVVDRDDVAKVRSKSVGAIRDSNGGTVLFVNAIDDPHDTVHINLAAWLLGILDQTANVIHVNGRTDDFRKSNLRRSR